MYNSFALSRKKDIAMKNNQNMLLASVLILIGCNNLIGAVERSQDSMDNLSKQLLNAANVADLGSVRRLLVAKADMEAVNKNGETPLLCVAWRGHADVVRELVTAKANIEAADRFGYTPLIYAAACGKLDVVRELLTARANMEAANNTGATPLHYAARNEWVWVDVVRELIAAKANVWAVNKLGETPLNLIKKNHNYGEKNREDIEDIIRILQEEGLLRERQLEIDRKYLIDGPLPLEPLCNIFKDYLFKKQ